MLAFTAGIAAAQQFPGLPQNLAILLLAIAAFVLWLARLRLPAACLFGLAWGLGVAAVRWQDALPAELEQQDLLIEGQVSSLPEAMDRGLRFNFQIDAALSPAGAKLPKRVRLSWYDQPEAVKAGERWRLHVRLKKPHGFLNPGGLDYELWLFSHGLRATGYVREDAKNQRLAGAGWLSLPALRQAVFDRLTQALENGIEPPRGPVGGEGDLVGVITALTLGEENLISPEQWDVLRRTGTAHLVAVSGSHISLVAGLVYWLALRICAGLGLMRKPPYAVAAVLALLAACAYAALAGFAIPTQRALVMLGVATIGIVGQRNLRPVNVLSLALLLVLLYDPLAVLSIGFWLSYGAVALILLAVSGRLRLSGWWGELLKTNWVVFVGLAPLMLLFFQQVSFASLPANALAVPSIGVILTPLCLFGTLLLGIYQPAGECVLHLVAILLRWVWLLLQWLSDRPWAQWSHPAPPFWSLPFALTGAMLLASPRGIPARWLGLVLLLPAALALPEAPPPGHFRLTLLDVGQGLSAVVQTQGHVLVFDTGARFNSTFDTGSAVVEPFLHRQGIENIDTLVVSHGDNDHIGGAASLLKDFSVGQIMSSVPERLGPGAGACHAGQRWEWDGVSFAMLSPLANFEKENDNSCVLRVSSPSGAALLTGDIEQAAEQQLVERYGPALRSDILIAPHHGSNTSSSAAFLAQVRPGTVLIPLGYRNRYHFPHPEVLKRYQAMGAKILDSAQAGAISVEPGAVPPTAYRETGGHYWNAR